MKLRSNFTYDNNNKTAQDLDVIHNELKELEEIFQKYNISDEAFERLLNETFSESFNDDGSKWLKVVKSGCRAGLSLFLVLLTATLKCCCIFLKLLLLLTLILLIVQYSPIHHFILRHSQDLIYPVMRQVRLWTLPIIIKYDHLTEWHYEQCLVQNPFYDGARLECWPCEDVRTVVDLTGLHNYSKAYLANGKPFIVRDGIDKTVSVDILRQIYVFNNKALNQGTASFLCDGVSTNLSAFFKNDKKVGANFLHNNESHVAWKMNRVEAARVMRKVFVRPYFVPKTSEVTLQRYIYFDGPAAAQYRFPLTDFANVWLAQGFGYRLIVLDPSETCRKNCSTVSVVLKPKDVLYYNWQFWRPRSLPARISSDNSVTFMGSFY